MGHEGHCAHPHGHNYYFEITAEAPQIDEVGRVVDFSVIKQAIGEWIENLWDHGFVHHQDDKAVIEMLDVFDGAMARQRDDAGRNLDRGEYRRSSHGAPCKRFALPYNPTAENLARYLLEVVCKGPLNRDGVKVVKIVCHETDNCKAEVTP